MNGKRLPIRRDRSAVEVRKLARRESDRAAAARMLATADALEGMARAGAARPAGVERRAPRDAVARHNAEGLAGLRDRPHPGPRPRLDEARLGQLRRLVPDGPDVGTTGLSAWTLAGLRREVEARWGAACREGHMPKAMRKPGLSRRKARPSHPEADPAAREAFAEGGCGASWTPSRPGTRASA